MKLQQSTRILMIIALVLAGGVYVVEIRGKSQQQQVQARQDRIFDISQDEIQSLIIETGDRTLKIERVGEDETDAITPWKMLEPMEYPANIARVNAVLNQLVNTQRIASNPNSGISKLTISKSQLEDYGLVDPQESIQIQLRDETTHRLVLGKSEFSGDAIYAMTNPPETLPENISILVISKTARDAISHPLDEWIMARDAEDLLSPETPETPTETPTEMETEEVDTPET
ncbi:hypothetical protein SPLC1_S300490 [Arthrospira platensis C1]|nr:hypothetical protein SPLC1_S300490 [Arthrospira platensis C1]